MVTIVVTIFFLIFLPLSKRNNKAVCKSRLGVKPIPMHATAFDD